MASFTATQAVLRNSYYLALQLTLQRANILTSMNPICPIAASLCIRQFGKTLYRYATNKSSGTHFLKRKYYALQCRLLANMMVREANNVYGDTSLMINKLRLLALAYSTCTNDLEQRCYALR